MEILETLRHDSLKQLRQYAHHGWRVQSVSEKSEPIEDLWRHLKRSESRTSQPHGDYSTATSYKILTRRRRTKHYQIARGTWPILRALRRTEGLPLPLLWQRLGFGWWAVSEPTEPKALRVVPRR